MAQTATAQFTITIVPQLVFTGGSFTAQPGKPFSAQLKASGGVPPYTFALHAGSNLPAGITLSASGLVSGTPSASGTFTFQADVKDSTP